MSWARLDDAMWAHPKMLALSGDAGWLWARALSWASGQGASGWVPEAALGILTAHIDARWRRRRVAELVDAGLWDPVDGGWRIHDFDEYQPQQRAGRETVRAVRSEAGRRGAHRRWHAGRPDPACSLCDSTPQAGGDPVWPAEASNGHAPSPPDRADHDPRPVDNSVPEAAAGSHNGHRSETDRRQIGDSRRGNGEITVFSMTNRWPRPVRVPDANPGLLEGEGGVGGGGAAPESHHPTRDPPDRTLSAAQRRRLEARFGPKAVAAAATEVAWRQAAPGFTVKDPHRLTASLAEAYHTDPNEALEHEERRLGVAGVADLVATLATAKSIDHDPNGDASMCPASAVRGPGDGFLVPSGSPGH